MTRDKKAHDQQVRWCKGVLVMAKRHEDRMRRHWENAGVAHTEYVEQTKKAEQAKARAEAMKRDARATYGEKAYVEATRRLLAERRAGK